MFVVQAGPLRDEVDGNGDTIAAHLEQGVMGLVDAISPMAFQQVGIALGHAVLVHPVIERQVDLAVEQMAELYRIAYRIIFRRPPARVPPGIGFPIRKVFGHAAVRQNVFAELFEGVMTVPRSAFPRIERGIDGADQVVSRDGFQVGAFAQAGVGRTGIFLAEFREEIADTGRIQPFVGRNLGDFGQKFLVGFQSRAGDSVFACHVPDQVFCRTAFETIPRGGIMVQDGLQLRTVVPGKVQCNGEFVALSGRVASCQEYHCSECQENPLLHGAYFSTKKQKSLQNM